MVLDLLQRQRLSVAVAVNEFGESIGVLSIEDIMRQVLTSRFDHLSDEAQAPVIKLANQCYQVNGAVSVRKLCKAMELAAPDGRSVSVSTLMQRIIERPPKLGDRCEWDDYRLTVIEETDIGCVLEVCHIHSTEDSGVRNAISGSKSDIENAPSTESEP